MIINCKLTSVENTIASIRIIASHHNTRCHNIKSSKIYNPIVLSVTYITESISQWSLYM